MKLLFGYSSKDGGVSQQQVCWDQLSWWQKVQNKLQGKRMCKCDVCTLTCLKNGHVRLFISQKNSTLPALIRNCPFIKFSKKWHPGCLLSLPICKIEVFFHSISCTMMSNLPLLTTNKYKIR